MKNKFLKQLTFAVIITALFACEKSLEVYHAGSGLTFYYENAQDTLLEYSFVYSSQTTLKDTIWVKVETIGPLSDRDRAISVEQVETNGNDAIAGTHYLVFDDVSLKEHYVIDAGESMDSIPVVLLRDESLKTESVTLLIRIKENEEFLLIDPERYTVKIIFTDQLIAPANWGPYCTMYFGAYGPVKHQWLIDQTGNKWDDDYLSDVLGFTSTGVNSNFEGGYILYLRQAYIQKLAAYNEDRIAQGLDVLKEEDGTAVSF